MEKKYINHALSFLLPLLLLCVVFIFNGIYPFGNSTLLSYDMSQQYIQFYSYLNSVISGDNSLSFTFAQTLGGESIGLFAYYLISPFNILFIIFKNNLVLGVFLVTIFKIAFSGLTMSIYLEHKKSSHINIVFAIAYSLMAYNILYATNLMWLDGVLILPIVMLGIDKILEGRKISITYVLALAYALITNYYIGYMICIMSIIYFIYKLIKNSLINKNTYDYMIIFAFSSIVAAMISAFILIPTAMTLLETKAAFNLSSLLTLSRNHGVKECLAKLFIGSWAPNDMVNSPVNIYCSAIMIIFAIHYFFNGKISIKDRILTGLLCLFMLASAMSTSLDLIWHVLNVPNCYPGRYSFVITFIILIVAHEDITNLNPDDVKFIVPSAIIYGALGLYLSRIYTMDVKYVLIFTVLTIAVCILIYINEKFLFIICAGIICCLDLTLNSYLAISQINYESTDSFNTYYNDTKDAIDYVKDNSSGLYRLEKNFVRQGVELEYNDSYMFDYAGISCFSSITKDSVKTFSGRMGYRDNLLKIVYGKGSTLFSDSLLGIKYILSFDETIDYNYVNSVNGINIYENPNALSIAIGDLGSNIGDVDFTNTDTFLLQNDLFKKLTNTDADIHSPISNVSVTYDNIELNDNNILVKTDSSNAGTITYHLKAANTGTIYYRVAGTVDALTSVSVNGEDLHEYYAQSDWNIFSIYANAGEEYDVTVSIGNGNCNMTPIIFYSLNEDVYNSGMDTLKEHSVDIACDDSNSYSFDVNITAENNRVLFTIPYDEAFRCYVDGELYPIDQVYDCLMSVSLSEGTHHVVLEYNTAGDGKGIVISIIGILFFAISILYPYIKKNYTLF